MNMSLHISVDDLAAAKLAEVRDQGESPSKFIAELLVFAAARGWKTRIAVQRAIARERRKDKEHP